MLDIFIVATGASRHDHHHHLATINFLKMTSRICNGGLCLKSKILFKQKSSSSKKENYLVSIRSVPSSKAILNDTRSDNLVVSVGFLIGPCLTRYFLVNVVSRKWYNLDDDNNQFFFSPENWSGNAVDVSRNPAGSARTPPSGCNCCCRLPPLTWQIFMDALSLLWKRECRVKSAFALVTGC